MTKHKVSPAPPKRRKIHWLGAIVVIVSALALIKGQGPERYLIVGGLIVLIGALLMHIERVEARKSPRDNKPPTGK